MMQQTELSITNPTGLHTRPGTAFVRLAKTFACDVTVQKNDKTANAKSLVKLLQIGISQGDTITLTCTGDGEATAVEQLVQGGARELLYHAHVREDAHFRREFLLLAVAQVRGFYLVYLERVYLELLLAFRRVAPYFAYLLIYLAVRFKQAG